MCEADAYVIDNGREEILMKAVDVIKPEGNDGYRIVNIFGEQRIIKGRIIGMHLVEHKILFEV